MKKDVERTNVCSSSSNLWHFDFDKNCCWRKTNDMEIVFEKKCRENNSQRCMFPQALLKLVCCRYSCQVLSKHSLMNLIRNCDRNIYEFSVDDINSQTNLKQFCAIISTRGDSRWFWTWTITKCSSKMKKWNQRRWEESIYLQWLK